MAPRGTILLLTVLLLALGSARQSEGVKGQAKPQKTLAADKFSCDKGKTKIFTLYLCDGVRDCKDGADESNKTCNSGFSCAKTNRLTCSKSGIPKRCYDPLKQCDNQKDCPNAEDEDSATCKKIDCAKTYREPCPPQIKKTPKGSQKVPVGYCVFHDQLCDGKALCPAQTDESKSFCKGHDCRARGGTFCPSGIGCLKWGGQICDGKVDCTDGSDEDKVFCGKYNCTKTDTVTCPGGGQCVSGSYQFCNGAVDCKDGSDEDPKLCKTIDCSKLSADWVQCPGNIGQCTSIDNICDGKPDCKNGVEEKPEFCRQYSCPEGRIKCPGNNTCISGRFCDGRADCPKGKNGQPKDEDPAFCRKFTCPKGHFKCKDQLRCIPETSVCDGQAQCKDRSDENKEMCSKYNCKASGRIFCPSGKYCLGSLCDICNGVKNCPDGSDEKSANCYLKKGTQCDEEL